MSKDLFTPDMMLTAYNHFKELPFKYAKQSLTSGLLNSTLSITHQ